MGEKIKAREETDAIKRNSIFRSKPIYLLHLLYVYSIKTFFSLLNEYYEKHENYSSSVFKTFLAGAMDFAVLNTSPLSYDN